MIARNACSACSVLALADRRGTVSRRMVPRRATRSPQDDILSGLQKIQTAPLPKTYGTVTISPQQGFGPRRR